MTRLCNLILIKKELLTNCLYQNQSLLQAYKNSAAAIFNALNAKIFVCFVVIVSRSDYYKCVAHSKVYFSELGLRDMIVDCICCGQVGPIKTVRF